VPKGGEKMNVNKKSRSLELFFVDGNPEGMLTATIPFQWSGHVLLCNRLQLKQALDRPESSRTGIYLLVGERHDEPLLYIGEGDDISQRIRNHDSAKDWWSKAVFITSDGEQLNKAHARYLESSLIKKAHDVRKISLENTTRPALPNLSEAARAHMDDFLENIYLVLPALRYDFFLENTRNIAVQSTKEMADKPIFILSTPKHSLDATAHLEGNDFIVHAGSKARLKWMGDLSKRTGYSKLHQDLIEKGILIPKAEHCIFSQSYAFSSPSAAGAVINGRETNGQEAWKVQSTGKTYREWEQDQLKEAHIG
jgi:hypothetical protein